MRKPLYSMSAGELGAMAHEVEHDLDRVLELSARWGAVLLLDECDVFLERRSLSDMHRNKLVSIFLRLLEYYQGVMFLTTNRVSAFDPAFESRIHLTIHYPNLDYKSRLHIRNTFASILSKSELEHLAHEELNGRQIKNIVKTARLLATNERTQLAMKHVNSVLTMKKALTESA
jgi:ATP-dependent 26S proteasome regulatory subunit